MLLLMQPRFGYAKAPQPAISIDLGPSQSMIAVLERCPCPAALPRSPDSSS
jgi:hypothetical protein